MLFLGFLPVFTFFWNSKLITSKWQLYFISEILLLHTIHTGFTFYLIWRSKEIRNAISQAYDSKPWKLYFKGLCVFVLTFLVIWLYQDKINRSEDFIFTVAVVLQFLGIQHSLSQILGISLLYDAKSRQERTFSDVEIKKNIKFTQYERLLHKVILVAVALRAAADISRESSYFIPILSTANPWTWHIIFCVATMGVVLIQFFRPHWKKSNKWIFNLRRLWDMTPVVTTNFIILRKFNHTFEYLAVVGAVENNAQKLQSIFFGYRALIFFSFSALVGFFYINQLELKWGPTPFVWLPVFSLKFLSAISTAISISHYFFDHSIYRFSKTPFRQNVLPLLTGKPV